MRLNTPQMMFLITLATAATAALCFIICLTLAFKLRSQRKRFMAFASETETDLAAMQETSESLATSAADQSRRLAWLESRLRQGKTAHRQEEQEAPMLAVAEPSLTERRHRVLSLARRGYDVNTIAVMLNELPGEVELIIGMSKAA